MIAIDRLVSVTMAGSPAVRVEPITLERTKKHLRVTSNSEDDLIETWIAAARAYLEEHAGRQTIDAMYEYTMVPRGRRIELPRAPLAQVLSVVSVDAESGAETLIDPTSYRVDLSGVASGSPTSQAFDAYCPPGAIELLNGSTWPSSAVRITRVCGYGTTPEQMPSLIQAALYTLVGHFYRNRAEVTAESVMALPMGADLIIKGLKYDALVVQR
jgi:uncharacterized phiE125 gp8 family phage protein